MSKYVNAAYAAEKIAEKHGIPIADLCDTFGDIPAADVAPVEWHAIEDCLPDVHLTRKICERVGVLVVVSDGGVRRTLFRSYERADVRGKTVCRWEYPWGRISHEHITHWAYLPEPPKEEE